VTDAAIDRAPAVGSPAKEHRHRERRLRRDEKITREVWDRDRAVAFFAGIGERYKAEYIGEYSRRRRKSAGLPPGQISSICARGPHLPVDRPARPGLSS